MIPDYIASELVDGHIRYALEFWLSSPETYAVLEAAMNELDDPYLEAWR